MYTAIIEKTGNGYSAYVPDLPGCVAAGDTRDETEALIREAVTYHLELLRESGDPVPEAGARTPGYIGWTPRFSTTTSPSTCAWHASRSRGSSIDRTPRCRMRFSRS